jgi:hypothetical protein
MGYDMTKGKLNPEEFTRNVQEFLFACAYWICAADEELRSEEQDWLIEQFGEKKTAAWLENCMNMESQAFLQHFDAMAHSLDDWQKRQVLPAIIPWLSDCVMADKQLDPAENQVLKEIRARLQLENEIDRLQKPAAKYGKTTGPESKTVNTSDAGAEMLAGQSAMARQYSAGNGSPHNSPGCCGFHDDQCSCTGCNCSYRRNYVSVCFAGWETVYKCLVGSYCQSIFFR